MCKQSLISFKETSKTKILEGHYLNLPVIGDGTIVGTVDVLKLTYVTLKQVIRSCHS